MPKIRFHEVYQDYVCGCVLRLGREVFALLPVEVVIVTACAEAGDSATNDNPQAPVLSTIFWRNEFLALDFYEIHPSEAIERFRTRSSLKASRKTGIFQSIEPWDLEDLGTVRCTKRLSEVQADIRRLRNELAVETERIFE